MECLGQVCGDDLCRKHVEWIVQCDSRGCSSELRDYFTDSDSAMDRALADGWEDIKGRHYCPRCRFDV